ncbi:DUF5694 domain-containing protein [Rhodohalobacter sp.]|uniref:DUF5694 domain-containing protein n=1 Tax=Rhodohalobacter sp. TaxID=1974210 RepID=UPI002ACE105A|nr:DUF5694 domain-containing protein [Rhodohalobacter sp.]MDZ7757391.1 DUF5694 domain-containing protein [Rhodohalobacter sp.]
MKNHTFIFVFWELLFLISIPAITKAQFGHVEQTANNKPTLVILGTYHMATTSSNVINIDVDDVTSPERQRQMLELIDKLKTFKPTKIALECDYKNQSKIVEQYNDYLSGNFELTRSEVHQIGYRLAKESGHKKVFCIDWGIFPEDPLYNYESYSRQHPRLNEYLNNLYEDNEDIAKNSAEKITSRTITENLMARNEPVANKKSHQGYFKFLRIGKEDEYVGANYLSWWYERNLKILTNIIRFTESPDDRILVVYGAGHNYLLNQFAKESGFYEVESPLKYLMK